MANDRRNPIFSESTALNGVHGGMSADALPRGYISQGLNLQVRGGNLKTRPRYKSLGTFTTAGEFRGAYTYSLASGDTIVFGVDDTIYEFNPLDGTTATVATFPTNTGPFYFVQADRYLVVQNGTDLPYFYERGGAISRFSTGVEEIPAGTHMAYAHGRIYLVPRTLADGTSGAPYWIAGDILLPLNPSNVLKLTENEYWNEGGATGLPFEAGTITALAVMQNAQTGTGLGALLAFGRSGVSAHQVDASREDWKSLDFSQVLFTGDGATGQFTVTPVNSDVMFRSAAGIQSIRLSSASDRGWSVRPISYEIEHRLEKDPADQLKTAYSAFANNEYVLTSAGYGENGWNGVVVLDTLVSSMMTQANPPAYNDLWVSCPVQSVNRCRVDGKPQVVTIFRRGNGLTFAYPSNDLTKDFDATPVKTRVYTRAYKYDDLMSLQFVDVIFRNIESTELIPRVYYRTDFYPRWTPCGGPDVIQNRIRSHIRFPAEIDGCLENGLSPRTGNSVQFCIEWTGVAEIEKWSAQINPEITDPAQLLSCTQAGSALSPSLDLAMVTLDDVGDTLCTL